MTKSEKPILFSGPMVCSILEDRKTQTRRVIKPQPTQRYKAVAGNAVFHFDGGKKMRSFVGTPEKVAETLPPICPYGKPGDRLWVRETWAVNGCYDYLKPSQLTAVGMGGQIAYRAGGFDFEVPAERLKWRPSIFMPRWASRITLEIVRIRVERLQEISHKDAVAEAAPYDVSQPDGWPLSRFPKLWDSINWKRKGCAWNDNPWVWCLTFKRVERTAV